MSETATRAPARSLTADEQREHIVGMVLRREWSPGVSHKQLADEWGLGVRTVSQRALEAMHAVRVASNTQLRDFVVEALAELDSMQAAAMSEEKVVCVGKDRDSGVLEYERVPQPNVRAAAYCVELKAKMLGAFAATKHDHTHRPIEPGEDVKAVRAKLVAALEDVDRQIAAAEPKEVH